MRKIVLFTAFALLLLMVGCTNNDDVSSSDTSDNNSQSSEEKELSVAGYGGSSEEVMVDEILPSFEEKHGIRVNYKGNTSVETLSALNASKSASSPVYDVAILDVYNFTQGKEDGIWDSLDSSSITNLENIDSEFIDEEGLGAVLGTMAIGMVYNKEAFEENNLSVPTGWKDLERPELDGKFFLYDLNNGYGLSTFLMLSKINGGGLDNVEPGFDKLNELIPHAELATSNAIVEQMLQRKELWMGPLGNNRAYALIESGVPLEFIYPEEGLMASPAMIAQVNKTENPSTAQLFIDYMLSPEVQLILAEHQKYAPSNNNVDLPDELQSTVPTREQVKNMTEFDIGKINSLRSDWSARWDREVSSQ